MAIDQVQLGGYFKRVYEDGLENAMSQNAELQGRIKFRTQKRLGDSYNFPIKLRRSHGTTWDVTGTGITLNDPVSMLTKSASASGTLFYLQEDVAYATISRAQEQGAAAFGDVMDDVVLGMREDAQFYQEMTLLHGGVDIGVVSANAGTGTIQTITISAATWAAGVWSQFEGGKIDAYTAGFTTLINLLAPINVTSVKAATRQLVLQGQATDLAAVTTGVRLVPYGAHGKWFNGLQKIFQNTATLYGIDAGTYTLWKANSYTAGSAKLTMAKVQAAITSAVGRGLMEDVICVCSPYTWTDINDDTAGLRRFASDTKREVTLGTTSIKFHGVNNGSVELVSHPMAKAGVALIFPESKFVRVGSTDTTSRLSNAKGQSDHFFQDMESKAAVRLRSMWDLALVPKQPAKCVVVTGIVNESGPA